jgi:CHAT domain-containing protein/tetratricopeptide (TPR) repeat protein
MKLRVVLAIVVCTLGADCTKRDTGEGGEWRRSVEPWMSGMTWQERTSIPAPVRPDGRCETAVLTMADVRRLLTTNLRCIDAAIDALERFARADANALSDLAGAYYVRAKADDQPLDYLAALEAADEAVRRTPSSPAAHFNRALIQDIMGLYDEALASYGSLRGPSGWVKEARQRHAALQRKISAGAMPQWELTRPQLDAALRARNVAAIAKLIDPYPAAAQRYLETEVLRRWAESGSAEDLAQATLLASALTARLGDRYFVDTVEAIRKGPVRDLRRGHLKFAEGRQAELRFERENAERLYVEAARAFARANSPFRFGARLAVATAREDLPALDPLEREVRTAGYSTLLPRIAWVRGQLMTTTRSDYLDGLEQYNSAVVQYIALRDFEGTLSTRVRRAATYRAAGQPELAWKELLQEAQNQRDIGVSKEVQALATECASATTALGRPLATLHYRQMIVRHLRKELQRTPPENYSMFEHLRTRLGAALRSLADAEIDTERFTEATIHLRDAERLVQPKERAPRNLIARLAEVRGKQVMRRSPRLAVNEFTRAIQWTDQHSLTELARLHTQRALVYRSLGQREEAEHDLRAAIALLQEEEEATVLNDRGTGEPFWSGYFSRFDETYALLIQGLADDGRDEDAYWYAERARGFEPLHRILPLAHTPPAFRTIAKERQLKDIRMALPPGTFILEYTVLENETLTWILWRDGFELVRQPATRSDVERWTKELNRAVATHNDKGFEQHLVAPYHGLMAKALTVVRQASGGGTPRLVIVPDRVMQGLPFAAFRSSPTSPYLVRDAIIEWQGSALLYVFSLMRDRAMPHDPSLLLIGNPEFDPTLPSANGLGSLTSAEQEVHAIYARHRKDAELRIGREATISEFLELARRNAIVHLALHAVVNARAPHQSVLLLARASDTDRGALEAQELLRRAKLDRTRLVILSACSSAVGAPVGPEGVGPLVRPLLAAGVPAVLGTLWRVNDATAQQVLVSFHQHFQTGSDAAVALRDAQLELLGRSPLLKRAITWAPYQVIGHATSPYRASKEKEEPP